MTLNEEVEEFLKSKGAIKVGFATIETLAGGPPSSDLTYILPEAQSAISFALTLNKEYIRDFLSKKNWKNHMKDNIDVNKKAFTISNDLIKILKEKGFKAKQPPPPGNYISFRQTKHEKEEDMNLDNQYRQEVSNWRLILPPRLSQRYVAVRSGVGSYGWSGCIGIKDIGTNIILGGVVTDAKLNPTDPEPSNENFCDNCKICTHVCVSNFMKQKEETNITLGKVKFSHSARRSKLRCQLVCGGFSGLHSSGKWSTWSPGRYQIPEDDKKMIKILSTAVMNYQKWPENTMSEYDPPYKGLRLTCAFCQLVCFGNKQETIENYKLIKNSGCVIQKENGDYIILQADEAKEYFEQFPKKHQEKYYIKKRKKRKTHSLIKKTH